MKEKIKVAFILPSLANRGPVVFTKYLTDNLKNRIDLVDVYYFDDKVGVEFKCSTYNIKSIKDIDVYKYDIIQTTMFRPDINLAVSKKLNRTKGYPVVISGIHNYIYEDMEYNYGYLKGLIISKVWLFFLKLFDGIIYSSDEMVNYYSGVVGGIPYKRISYGINEVSYKDLALDCEVEIRSLKENNYKIIGAVGLLIKRKGFHQIIEALKGIKDHALILIGSGPEEMALKKLVKEYGLTDRVVFTGFQQNSKEYYKYFDVYCLCSYSEGFGLAMLEALSAKIPLVCSNLAIYNEYFSKEYVGIFEVDNIDSLIFQIDRVNKDKCYFSESSYRLFKKYFHVDKMAYEHVNFYKELLEKKM